MLANCKYFAATEGSVSHNSIFLKDNSQAIIIPRGPYFSGYQQIIDSMFNLEIYYIDSALTAFSPKSGPWSGPNYFYVSEELMEFFNLSDDEKNCFRKKNFCDINQYAKYCLVNLSGRKYYIDNVYAEKFFYYLGLNSTRVFPLYYLKNKISNLFGRLFRKKR